MRTEPSTRISVPRFPFLVRRLPVFGRRWLAPRRHNEATHRATSTTPRNIPSRLRRPSDHPRDRPRGTDTHRARLPRAFDGPQPSARRTSARIDRGCANGSDGAAAVPVPDGQGCGVPSHRREAGDDRERALGGVSDVRPLIDDAPHERGEGSADSTNPFGSANFWCPAPPPAAPVPAPLLTTRARIHPDRFVSCSRCRRSRCSSNRRAPRRRTRGSSSSRNPRLARVPSTTPPSPGCCRISRKIPPRTRATARVSTPTPRTRPRRRAAPPERSREVRSRPTGIPRATPNPNPGPNAGRPETKTPSARVPPLPIPIQPGADVQT